MIQGFFLKYYNSFFVYLVYNVFTRKLTILGVYVYLLLRLNQQWCIDKFLTTKHYLELEFTVSMICQLE